MTDVVIAGAGPAGSSLAIHLARQGREVVLLDRATFPREKACGEGVMPAGVAGLHRLGIVLEGAPFNGVRYHHNGRTVAGTFPNGAQGLGIRRRDLDAALAARAGALTGIPVEGPIIEGGIVRGLIAGGREYRAKLTVAADGANSLLRHKLGWDASKPSRRFGMRRHYRSTGPTEPWVDVHLGDRTETYITPLPNNELLIATLGETHPTVDLGPAASPCDEPLGAAPLTVRASQRYAPGCVLLGDAAGSCDPITGGGISQALLSAELLAASIDDLAAFDRARESMLRNYRRLTAGVLALADHPALLRPALSILGHSPKLFTRLLAIAGGVE